MVQKVAIITGASRGIGAALVPAYRKLGYAVVAVARSIENANDPGGSERARKMSPSRAPGSASSMPR